MKFQALVLSVSVLALSSVASASAQDSSRAAAADEIVVTGTKRETTLQDADVAATVLTREALQEARVTDFRRIDDLAPNVQFNDRGPLGAVYISIRGVESNPFIVNRAAVYIDGIPFRQLNNSVLAQLDSVEVLRGPQSTLYGANSESGLVIINTRSPGDELNVTGGFTGTFYETGEAYQGDAYIGGPIVEDKLAGSVSVRYSDRDYFLRNIGSTPQGQGKVDELFVQGRLRWTPTENLTVNATGYVIDTNAPGVYLFDGFPVDLERYNAIYSDGLLFDPANPFSPAPVNGDLRASDFEFVSDAPKRAEIDEVVAGLSAVYETGIGSINVALSYRSEETDDRGFDIDATNGPFLAGAETEELELWNGEVRFSSHDDMPFVYSVGASFYTDKEIQTLASLIGPGGLDDFSRSPEQSVESLDFGVFGSASYSPPAIPNLTGTVGLRYDRARRETTQQAGVLDLGFNVFVFDELQLEDTFDAFLPRFALRYEPSDFLTLYANVAKGYLPGGFNLTAAQDGFQDDVVRYESEELWSYEVGAKWRSVDSRAFIAAAAFFIEADNYQEIAALIDDAGNVVSTSFVGSNAGIESYGFEIEGYWEPLDGLTFTGNFGYIDATYTDFAGLGGDSVIGNRVKLIPEYDANIAARYQHPSGFFVRGEINFLGDTPLDEGARTGFNLNAIDTQEAVEMLGAQIGYQSDSWSARIFGENLTNERRISGAGFPNAVFPVDGILYGAVDAPRIVGFEITFDY